MGFDRTELPSGVRVVTERLPGQRTLAIGVWVGTGSRDEPDELAGATHFLEHLLFKGTPTRSAFEIARAFDAVGGDLNAFTTKELTCFHARVLEEDLEMTLSILADMLQDSLLAPADVEAERSVVLEELAMHEDTPDDLVFDLFHESVWADHPLGRRVQGVEETVEAMGRDVIDAYYRDHYRPGNLVIAAAGAVDHQQVLDVVGRVFAGGIEPPRALRSGSTAPRVAGRLLVRERDIEQAHVVYGTQGIARTDERRWALTVLNVALGGGMSSRLFQEIREKRGLVYSITSGNQGFAETGTFTVYAGCSADRVGEVLGLVRTEIDAVVADGITDDELSRSIGHLRGSLALSLDDAGSMMTHLGKSELCHGEILTAGEIIARVEAVTHEDVRAAAREVLGASPWALTVLGPRVEDDVEPFVGTAA